MRLYNFDVSPFAARCRLAIYRKGLDVEIAAVPEGGPRGAAYRALNPIGKVPALELDDGTVIPESEVIVDYLEERFPEPPLLPETPEDRARVRLLSRLGGLYLMPPMGRLFGQMRAGGPRDAAVVDAALAEVGSALDHLEHFASGDQGGWIAGEAFTLADCALVPLLAVHHRLLPAFGESEPLGGHPKLAGYWPRVLSDPIVAKVSAEMEAGFRRMMAQG